MEALTAALAELDEDVRNAAAKALERIGHAGPDQGEGNEQGLRR
jgi:HEAT repeat protein